MSVHEDDAAAQLAIAAPPGQAPRFFKLPDFWTASHAAGFGVAEAQFFLRCTASQQDRFALVTAVLPEASACRVAHILAAPGDYSYDDLKVALLVAHQLTSYQKAEKLFSSEPLGDRRPSELLSEMLELVYPGEERSLLFTMLFLHRLPAAFRRHLTKDDHEDVRALANKADRCAASIYCHKQLLLVFAATADDCKDTEEQSDYPVSPWALPGVVASPSGPEAAKTAPKGAEAASGLSPATALPQGAQPGPAGWPLPQPLHLRREDLQLGWQLLLVGKPSSLGAVNAVRSGHLVFLKDHTTGTLFLANTGASVSLVPGPAAPQVWSRRFSHNPRAASSSPTHGTCLLYNNPQH